MEQDKEWTFKRWTIFVAIQVLIFSFGFASTFYLSLETNFNPLSVIYNPSSGNVNSFYVLVDGNTTTLNIDGHNISVNGSQIFDLSNGCYHVLFNFNTATETLQIQTKQVNISNC